jgi:hypothetical protein
VAPVSADVSETVSTTLPDIAARVVAALTATMSENMAREAAEIQRKLSGEVLQVRSGRLLGSVQINPPEADGEFITGSVQAGGEDVPWGVFQEYGTSGPYTIEASAAKALAFEVGGETVFAKSVTHPGLEERSFMRSTADDLRDQGYEDYQTAVAAALA